MPKRQSKFYAVTIDGRKHVEAPEDGTVYDAIENMKTSTYLQNNRVFAIIEESTIRYTFPDDFETEEEDRGDGYDYY